MATITKDALEWVQDELDGKDAIISDLEEELEAALEQIEGMRAEITRLMADRSTI